MASNQLRFGTDGIRGEAGVGLLSTGNVERLGRVLGDWLRRDGPVAAPVVLGGDTRASREEILLALARGLHHRAIECVDAGVLPTAGLALLAREWGAAGAMVVSASHNPAADNGIKVFARGAEKLGDADSAWIEQRWNEVESPTTASDLEAVPVRASAREEYLHLLRTRFTDLDLRGLRVAMDLAHGAAHLLAPELFRRLGAEVVTMGDAPDGSNINAGCGSLHLEGLCRLVVQTRADFGVAFDGDADRSLFVDDAGNEVDGDGILALMATDRKELGALPGDRVVGTAMTNFGLELYLRERGIELVRTEVGDRFISARMREEGLGLGGEPSGHVIFGDELHFLGDGPYTALRVAERLLRTASTLREALQDFRRLPQRLVGVRVRERPPLEQISGLREKLAQADEELSGAGRVVVRYSGTEPLVRIMVEGADPDVVESVTRSLTQFLTEKLGGS